ncbi:copper resistance CopC family protein [Pseudonocardia hydrocarbonoxydans]|uniref:Copper resistance protein C n=1 Tax=Pseudonocardia hydrocarbonoxydans TaxID=76726 RepID=A0A4Y3WV15_9PSEU|nr:copper resistance CopC family protein [Pseudonocardia hydrocarbonoxydans]GEC22727.1 copper resistance protein C [Pseudonocardia hydrocarbonoxydans]
MSTHHPRRPALRAVVLFLICGFALLAGTGVASAHTRLLGSDPADGTSLDTGPARVSLEFNETMQAGFSTITVVGPDGTQYQTGDVTADGGTVSVAVSPLGAAGAYEIGYRVISEDGHPVTGSVVFTLSTDGPAAAAPTPSATGPTPAAAPVAAAPAAPADEGGMPVWPWVVGAVVLIGGGIGAALRLGRS